MKNYKAVEITEFARRYGRADMFNEDIIYLERLPEDYFTSDSAPIYVNAFLYLPVDEGELNITVNGKSLHLRPGAMAVLSPSHLLKAEEPGPGTKYRALFINESLYGQVTFSNRLYYQFLMYNDPVVVFDDDETENMVQCVDLVVKRLRAKDHYSQKAAIQIAMFGFLMELANIIRHKQAAATGKVRKSDLTFRKFAELVMNNYKTHHNIAFYADKLNMSPQNLSLTVKAITGNTAVNFIYERLYHEARLLLHRPEVSIQEIADELRFSDPSAFGKFFKNRSGRSPIRFRSEHLV